MKILGIHEGHNGTAALMIDGQIVAAASEERFSKRKNECGYPKMAIDYCLKESGRKAADLDQVAVATIDHNLLWVKSQREATFSVDDYIYEQYNYFKPLLIDKIAPEPLLRKYYKEVIARKGDEKSYYDFSELTEDKMTDMAYFKKLRIKAITSHLGVDEQRIRYLDHHSCHQYYAYYSSPFRGDTLILTADGVGDKGINASVAVGTRDKIVLVATTTNCQIARIYRYITLLLGMKPFDHEYKVMGLAPYATSKEEAKAYRHFEDVLEVDGLDFKWKNRPKDLYFSFREKLEGHRFDGIAGALQKMTETIISQWAHNAVRHTGARRIVFAGGVAMNIKLNLILSELPGVEKVFVSPSPADESNALGACYFAMSQVCDERGIAKSVIKPLTSAYLGPSYDPDAVGKRFDQPDVRDRYQVRYDVTNRDLARDLQAGKVLGICRGRMEFGARALGNRSIVADPSNFRTVEKINTKIKYRDFWMPFAPAILAERSNDYFENPKDLDLPYMTIGLRSRPLARKELIAGLHPADFTGRPQFVSEKTNPAFHGLIKEFQSLTGIGGVLNTSLNLHGHPLVNSPDDAIFTMNNSDLDVLVFEKTALERRPSET